mmetsp:Transcript_130789/g.226312  ORF Transcript_130789/g.226312 Transcript_130789/m.226312 type:complete len:269 (-) Transcript_130789:167-973(-)
MLRAAARYKWIFQARAVPRRLQSSGKAKKEGLAIVWDDTQVHMLKKEFVDFNDQKLVLSEQDRTNNGALLATFGTNDGKNRFGLASVYLHWNPAKEDLKVRQARFLLQRLQRHAAANGLSALILMGDFNSVPGSQVYDLLATHTAADGSRLCSAYSRYLDLEKVHVPGSLQQRLGPTASTRKGLREPRYTNANPYKSFYDTIDYIFYTDRSLRPRRILALPPGKETEHVPNEVWSSDHTALACDLTFLPPDPRDCPGRTAVAPTNRMP